MEDLRDIRDLKMLERLVNKGEFKGKLSLGAKGEGLDKTWLETKRKELKLAGVRLSRLP